MLAVFAKEVGNPPDELTHQPLEYANNIPKSKNEISKVFTSSRPNATLFQFSDGSFMAMSHVDESPLHPRFFMAVDEIFCIFVGDVENISDLRKHYGLSRNSNEATLIIEVYKVLRDRAPYPSDQVIKDLVGNFAFILYDAKSHSIFAARDRDGGMKLHWGVANDGSLVLSDDIEIFPDFCGMTSSSFPTGCIFTNKTGLTSFVHPLYKVRGYRQEDGEGRISGVYFQVDIYTRLPSIPRVGSAQTWGDDQTGESGLADIQEG